jgi:hypothetical protein
VRGVGDELALGTEGCLQPGEQRIEGIPEFPELVAGAAEGQALAQAFGGDLAGGSGDGTHRPQDAAGHEPANRDREHGHQGQRRRGPGEELVQLDGMLLQRDA